MSFINTIVFGLVLLVIISFVLSLPVMILWDAVIPDIFGLREITWFQAWCLSLLCGILFKNNSSAVSRD